MTQGYAQKVPISAGGPAVAVGILSAVGIDPLGLGLGVASAPSNTSKDQAKGKTEFETLASFPGSFDLLNQSAGSSLTTLDILK